jgi:hypothetical protein
VIATASAVFSGGVVRRNVMITIGISLESLKRFVFFGKAGFQVHGFGFKVNRMDSAFVSESKPSAKLLINKEVKLAAFVYG